MPSLPYRRSGTMVYKLTCVDYTQELILNDEWPNSSEAAEGWSRFRINYRNFLGHSNIEGTLYFPPGVDPDPVLDLICETMNKAVKSVNGL